jgi:structural maintenance of chromosomes protein 5
VNKAYNAIKEKSQQVLEVSRQKVFALEPELREEYGEIEQTRIEYDNACKKAEKDGTAPPSGEGVELRSTEELRAELETQQANLEMNLNTNPGVVEQYEKRKKDVSKWPLAEWTCMMTDLSTLDRISRGYD